MSVRSSVASLSASAAAAAPAAAGASLAGGSVRSSLASSTLSGLVSASASASASGAGGGGSASLRELSETDKQKVARLLQELVRLGSENTRLRAESSQSQASLTQLRQGNAELAAETSSLRQKYGRLLERFREQQQQLQQAEAQLALKSERLIELEQAAASRLRTQVPGATQTSPRARVASAERAVQADWSAPPPAVRDAGVLTSPLLAATVVDSPQVVPIPGSMQQQRSPPADDTWALAARVSPSVVFSPVQVAGVGASGASGASAGFGVGAPIAVAPITPVSLASSVPARHAAVHELHGSPISFQVTPSSAARVAAAASASALRGDAALPAPIALLSSPFAASSAAHSGVPTGGLAREHELAALMHAPSVGALMQASAAMSGATGGARALASTAASSGVANRATTEDEELVYLLNGWASGRA